MYVSARAFQYVRMSAYARFHARLRRNAPDLCGSVAFGREIDFVTKSRAAGDLLPISASGCCPCCFGEDICVPAK